VLRYFYEFLRIWMAYTLMLSDMNARTMKVPTEILPAVATCLYNSRSLWTACMLLPSDPIVATSMITVEIVSAVARYLTAILLILSTCDQKTLYLPLRDVRIFRSISGNLAMVSDISS
jgi:hypothetical protein